MMFDGIQRFTFAGIRAIAHCVGDHRKARPLRRTAPLSRAPDDDERPQFGYRGRMRAMLHETAAISDPRHNVVEECV
jgi:hypothetical protein